MGVIVNRELDGRDITVSWDPNKPYPHPQNAPERKLKKVCHYEDIPVTISIKKKNRTIFLDGIVGDCHQMMIYTVRPARLGFYAKPFRFSRAPELVLHRLYDYIEVLGIGDGLGGFIGEYNAVTRLKIISQLLDDIQNDFFAK